MFLPPVETVEDYLDSCARVEATAERLGKRVRIEGYPPPTRPAPRSTVGDPDPGVIEVNMQPAGSWDEMVWNTSVLYEEARTTELRAEKFMLDGRHTGTGGGNHIVLGGPTPADSPILRRPDLLAEPASATGSITRRSRICSPGMFVGPTSQSPRVDEARNDALYELEIAFRELERHARPGGPALRRRGSSTGSSAICSSTSPATRTAPSSASTSSTAPTAPAAGRASSSCARSRCRRTRG